MYAKGIDTNNDQLILVKRRWLCLSKNKIIYLRFTEKEGNTVSVEEKNKNEAIYLASVAVLRRLYLKGVDEKTLERLNRKNAEAMGCIPTDFINYN